MSALVALYTPYTWFLAVWIAAPLVLIVATRSLVTRAAAPPTAAYRLSSVDVAVIVAFTIFFSCYAVLILHGEDLVGPDYAQLTAERFFGMPIWPVNRRFFPLGMQEYNMLGFLGKTALIYHTFSIYQLLIVLPAVGMLLAPASMWFRCAACAFVLATPSVVFSFFGLIYPERDIIFWMAVWLAALTAHARTGSRLSFALALISAQCMLYYKEVVFLVVASFAAGKMVLDAHRGGFSRDLRSFARAHVLELSHLALCAVFLGVYSFAMRSSTGASYAINVGLPGASASTFDAYVQSDPLLVVLAAVVALRMVLVITRKRVAEPMWDSLAVGALAYVAAYVKLAMIKDYYPAPADFIAVLYVARNIFSELRSSSGLVRAGVALVVALTFARNVSEDAFVLIGRKEYVAANRQMVDALESYSILNRRDTVQLFSPQVGGFQLMEFSAYLRYRGFRVLGDTTARDARGTVAVVKGPHRFPNDQCQPFQYFKCQYAPAPSRGDLVVYLPGRTAPAKEVAELKAGQVFMFVSTPSRIERALRLLVPADRLADRPIDAYMFQF